MELLKNKTKQPKVIEERLIKLEQKLKVKFSNCFESVRKAFLALDTDYDGFITKIRSMRDQLNSGNKIIH
jgi:hypothetical protein